jgi:hypothetical protein
VSAVRQQLISTVTAEMVAESPKMRARQKRLAALQPLCTASVVPVRAG